MEPGRSGEAGLTQQVGAKLCDLQVALRAEPSMHCRVAGSSKMCMRFVLADINGWYWVDVVPGCTGQPGCT